jgi:hypothetical protein
LFEADAAGDLVQDVFAILVEKLPEFTYDPQSSFRAWLKTVTLNRWREQARRRRTVPLPAGAKELADSAADAPTFLEEAEYADQLVRRAMKLIQKVEAALAKHAPGVETDMDMYGLEDPAVVAREEKDGQDPERVVNSQGRQLDHFLTLSDDEWDEGSFARWSPIEQDPPPDET